MASRPAQHHPLALLSPVEEAALRTLHGGRSADIDLRIERDLIRRGLVTLRDVERDGLVFHDMPILTSKGALVAAHLVAEQELVARLRRARSGFAIVRGGLA